MRTTPATHRVVRSLVADDAQDALRRTLEVPGSLPWADAARRRQLGGGLAGPVLQDV
ncbi:hypothetical protein OIE50_06845 [Streptomyces canus]|uniref:hypothetical protein n=1 Tax=Streptomyces canus TaxID=58343 RepID=UPI003252F845